MTKEIKNVPEKTREYADKIGQLTEISISKTRGTSEVSNDGLTARYSDMIIELLDNEMMASFSALFTNSREKLCSIADDFEKADRNASA